MTFTTKSLITDPAVARFACEAIAREDELETRLRLQTSNLPNGSMMSPADVGALLALLVRLCGAKRALEIGAFTGYTALKIARALPEHGRLTCLDINAEWTAIGRRFWDEAGVGNKVDLRLGPALKSMADLEASEGPTFDFVFIDANKKAYRGYYERALDILRPGGLVLLDNMLWDGEVALEAPADPIAKALRELNLKIARDPRVEACLLTVGDGVMLARKK